MFLVLRPVGSVSLGSFVLLERLAVLLASALAVDCWLGGFLDGAVGVMDFAGHFQGFVDDTLVWFLGSGLDLGLSCAGGFRGLVSVVAWCVGWGGLLALVVFQPSSLG